MTTEHFRTPLDGGPTGEIGKIFHDLYEAGRSVVNLAKVVIVSIPEDFGQNTNN